MNILSLFDGMASGRIAAVRAGLVVDRYYSSEVDKSAIKVSQANWPDNIQLGDIENWKSWDIDWASIDLLIGGSPCQGLSFSGKQLAFDDPRSVLFFRYVDILNHIKSVNSDVKFMLENVKMKKESLDVISDQLGVEPVFINSGLVSAQNRKRYYWANWEFGQPEDEGVWLKDVLESESDNFVFMTDKFVNRQKGRKCLVDDFNRKASSLSAMEYVKNGRQGDYLKHGDKYRKPTPVECERIQTVPDNYTNHVSNTQRYKMLGNGWTIDVIAYIFKAYRFGVLYRELEKAA